MEYITGTAPLYGGYEIGNLDGTDTDGVVIAP